MHPAQPQPHPQPFHKNIILQKSSTRDEVWGGPPDDITEQKWLKEKKKDIFLLLVQVCSISYQILKFFSNVQKKKLSVFPPVTEKS